MSTFDSFEVEVDDEEKGLYKVNIDLRREASKAKILRRDGSNTGKK